MLMEKDRILLRAVTEDDLSEVAKHYDWIVVRTSLKIEA